MHRVGLMRALLLFGYPPHFTTAPRDRLLTISVPLRQLLDRRFAFSILTAQPPAASFANTCNDFSHPLHSAPEHFFPTVYILSDFRHLLLYLSPDHPIQQPCDATPIVHVCHLYLADPSHVPSKNTEPRNVGECGGCRNTEDISIYDLLSPFLHL